MYTEFFSLCAPAIWSIWRCLTIPGRTALATSFSRGSTGPVLPGSLVGSRNGAADRTRRVVGDECGEKEPSRCVDHAHPPATPGAALRAGFAPDRAHGFPGPRLRHHDGPAGRFGGRRLLPGRRDRAAAGARARAGHPA